MLQIKHYVEMVKDFNHESEGEGFNSSHLQPRITLFD
jgi:hypothetical protein